MAETTPTSPEHVELSRMIAESPPMDTADLAACREALDAMGKQFPLAANVSARRSQLGGRPCEWYSYNINEMPERVVLFVHGGGYTMGSLESHRHLASEICRLTEMRAVLLDFRRAPEHPFPASLDDVTAAYRELLQTHSSCDIGLMGDSSGGGLAMAFLASLCGRDLPAPACAYIISPFADLEFTGESVSTNAERDILTKREALTPLVDLYLQGHDPRDPIASPIHADLHGIPPLLIQVSSTEILLDDAIRLAAAASRDDVRVTLDVWPEMLHSWPHFYPMLPEGRQALEQASLFIRTHLGSL